MGLKVVPIYMNGCGTLVVDGEGNVERRVNPNDNADNAPIGSLSPERLKEVMKNIVPGTHFLNDEAVEILHHDFPSQIDLPAKENNCPAFNIS